MRVLIKTLIWLPALAPLAWLLWRAQRGGLGPDPGQAVVLFTGVWALRLLLATLALRPLRDLTGWVQCVQVRRLVGLFAWFYASLHLLAALFYIVGFSWREIQVALVERAYITLGISAWLLLLPLAMTSTRWAQRRLGRRWRQLHRLIYPAALLACLHFIWLIRADYFEPVAYLFLLLLLLGWRIKRDGWRSLSVQSDRLANSLSGKESAQKRI
jgi:sulfoxide reductase heme-binding subunit YedZ